MTCPRKDLVNAMRSLYTNGFVTMRDGNVSYKPKQSNYFLITAGGIQKNLINEDQIIPVCFDTTTHPNTLQYNDNILYKPSREINMHALLQTHDSLYDIDSFILHAHPPNIISFMGVTQSRQLHDIKHYFPEINVDKIGRNVPFLDAGSNELAIASFKNLYSNDIVGLERHGTLSVGPNIDRLMENIETLEFYTGIFLRESKSSSLSREKTRINR